MEALLCPSCGKAHSELDSRCAACGAALPLSAGATELSAPQPAGAAPAGPSPPAGEPVAGRRISHYRLLRPLGRGGMGVVYLAEDIELGREVAIKFLHHQRAARPADEARFRREAQAAAALDHPSIGTVYEVGEHEGLRFLAMAFYQGTTLAQLLRLSPGDGPTAYEAAVVYAVIGDRRSALYHARRAASQGFDPNWFALPFFDPLRGDPAFQRLAARSAPSPLSDL